MLNRENYLRRSEKIPTPNGMQKSSSAINIRTTVDLKRKLSRRLSDDKGDIVDYSDSHLNYRSVQISPLRGRHEHDSRSSSTQAQWGSNGNSRSNSPFGTPIESRTSSPLISRDPSLLSIYEDPELSPRGNEGLSF